MKNSCLQRHRSRRKCEILSHKGKYERKRTNTGNHFGLLLARIKKSGTNVEQIEPPEGEHYQSLMAQFPLEPGSDRTFDFDFSFIPDLVGSGSKYLNLQSFVQLSGEADLARCPDLLWMIAKINRYLPIGSFGVFDSLDVLYWKQNSYLDGDLDPELNTSLIMEQTQFAQRIIIDFRDTFLDVIAGRATAMDALKANKWGTVLLND